MRRSLKITAWVLGSVLLLVLLTGGAVFLAGNTRSGRHLLERLTASLSDGHVQLRGLGGAFPADLYLEQLQLSDDRGVWLSAADISLQWSPLELLRRHIQVDSLRIDRLRVERRPVTHPSKNSAPPSIPHADLVRLWIRSLDLGPELAPMPMSLRVRAAAHFRSLQEASASLNAQRTGGLGDYELWLQFSRTRMDATLQLREPANGPLQHLLQVPRLGELTAFARLSGPRSAESIQLTLDAGALHGRLSGSLDLPAAAADLSYTLDAAQMTPAPDFSWHSVALHGTWHGPLATAAAAGHLHAEQLNLPGGTRIESLTADLAASRGLLSTRAVATGLVIPGSHPGTFQASPLVLDASVHFDEKTRPVQLTVTHNLFALHAAAVTRPNQAARIELRLPDLAPFGALAGQSVRGDSSIKALVAHDQKVTRLTADAEVRIADGDALWSGVVRGRTRVQLTSQLTAQSVSLDRLTVTGDSLSLSASGTAQRTPAQELDARFALHLTDLARLSPTLAGNLKLTGKVSGPSDSLATALDLTTSLSVRGSPQGALAAAVRAQGLPRTPRGTIEAHGNLDAAPIRLNISLQQVQAPAHATAGGSELFHAIIHHADWKSAQVAGEVAGGVDVSRSHGRLTFRLEQLSDLNRLLGANLQGAVQGTLAMRPEGGSSRAQLRIEAHDLASGSVRLNAQLSGSGPLDALALQLDLQSPAIAGQAASATTTSLLNFTARTLKLARAEARYHGEVVHLVAPTQISFANGVSLSATQLKAQQAVLQITGRLAPVLDVRASLRDLRPELINSILPGTLCAGRISGDADVQGSVSTPQGHVRLKALGMRSASDLARGLPAVDVQAAAQLMGNTSVLDVKLAAGSRSRLTLRGHAPLAADGVLDLQLAGNLDVGLLNSVLEAKGRHVTGLMTLDTTVTGPARAPQIGGRMRLAQGSFRDYAQGLNLAEITADIAGDGSALRIVSLTARAAPGSLAATGTAKVLDPGMPVDIKLTAKNAQPITNSIITANVDADLQVSGKAREQLDIGGAIRVNRADVGIPSSLPPNVAVLDVRRPGQAPPPRSAKPLIVRLDFRVQAPRQILVQGRGLDAELGGELRVSGTADSPQVSGGFDLQRGTFDIVSSRLTFSNGSVTFNGAGLKNKLDPTLDFTAQTAVFDATATVRITGFADSPKIELSSTPELPQDEILARLLFGESAAQLTALQVVQIGTALATLSGGGGGLNPLARIQKTLGLDRLSVAGGGSGTRPPGTPNSGATIEAGRYVSSRVFLAVKESTTGTSQLAVDVDLTKHLKLQTRLGNGSATAQGTTPENDPGSSVGLAYQFEY